MVLVVGITDNNKRGDSKAGKSLNRMVQNRLSGDVAKLLRYCAAKTRAFAGSNYNDVNIFIIFQYITLISLFCTQGLENRPDLL